MLNKLFGTILALLTASRLKPLTTRQQVGSNQINPFPSRHFRFYGGPTNGASRHRKTNRLHLSRNTKNKHR